MADYVKTSSAATKVQHQFVEDYNKAVEELESKDEHARTTMARIVYNKFACGGIRKSKDECLLFIDTTARERVEELQANVDRLFPYSVERIELEIIARALAGKQYANNVRTYCVNLTDGGAPWCIKPDRSITREKVEKLTAEAEEW